MILYRSHLIPPKPYVPGQRSVCKEDYLRLLDMIIHAAKDGMRCPSNETITDRLNLPNSKTAPNILFDKLISEGMIHLFRSHFGRVAYVIDLGLCTARPKNGKNAPQIESWYREIVK